jgi:hypothetical protein
VAAAVASLTAWTSSSGGGDIDRGFTDPFPSSRFTIIIILIILLLFDIIISDRILTNNENMVG